METFLSNCSPAERQLFESLDHPQKIQAFLDSTAYAAEYSNRCPLRVLRERRAHCLDGAIFAAAALRQIGFPPLLVDIFPDPGMDDDHVLAIYRLNGGYGAVAKSNFSGLRRREPVYRSLRELVMSYFEQFFNLHGQRTLRTYTRPLNLATLDARQWMTSDSGADAIEQRLLHMKRIHALNSAMIASLTPVDELPRQVGLIGSDPAGLYQPKLPGQ